MMRQLMLALVLLILPPPTGLARDNGQYAQVDPVIRDWFRSRTDRNGVNCCDMADGTRLEDPEWDCSDDDHCWVILAGVRMEVPVQAIIKSPNMVGYAIVWWINSANGVVIRCFQSGSRA